ncbi:cytotoxic and regulatory T-cell molecule-like isoform X2 [Artemia franciscana]|uniref:Ig-like domain-containing protein n=1 Tax=Artemia franciscana TaxID=6661 RepID=A0AA88IEM9_ARTSF|nr:hypothetical protein QYM36_007949 [Artemia franciscana]
MGSSFFSWLGIVVQFALIKCSLSIRLLQVTVPSVIQAGETATLQCIFDLEQDRLYSVKWYKDNVEFFRFIPKLDPPIATYVVDGLRVDERSSSDQNVVLPNVGLPSSGHYKCEVSAEAPSFVSVSGGGVIEVVVLPQGKPSITGGQSKYQVGDYVDINCTSAPSKPPAILNWYINGKQAPKKVLKQYKTVVGTNNLESTVLGLSFRVEEHHVLKSSLLLKCASSVGSLTKGSFDLEDLGEKISDINNHEKIEAQVGWPSLSESEVLHIANSSSHSFLSLVLISTTIFSTLFIL